MSLATLHDPVVRDAIRSRVASLQSTAQRRWGKMTVDQMLWHCNASLENALGRYEVERIRIPLPSTLMKLIVLRIPWRRGKTPTSAELVARSSYDFEVERARTLRLLDEFAARPLDDKWHDNAYMGRMSGHDWSCLQAKHLDHHLTQFGA